MAPSVAFGSLVSLSATVADAGANHTLTCFIEWGDDTGEAGVISAGVCSASHTYAAPGEFTITVTASDDDEADGTDSVTITVEAEPNTPPSAEANGPYTADEGADVVIDGTAADADEDTLTYAWSAEPGLDVDAGASCAFADAAALDTSVACTDDGTWTLTLTVSDGVDDVSDTASSTIANVAPTVDITAPADGASVAFGSLVSLSATVADAGANHTLTCFIEWGDDTGEAGVISAGVCSASHTYVAPGEFTITVTASDDDEADGTASVTITVEAEPNTPPSAEANGPYTADEGADVVIDGTAADADEDTLTYAWSAEPGLDVDAGASCAFADAAALDTSVACTDDGTWTLTLTVSDGVDDVSDTASLTIANVAPTVDITAPADGASVAFGSLVSLSATVADAGANDTLTCFIEWGDDTGEAGVISAGVCSASHTYAAPGEFTITVTASDDDEADGTASVTITVEAEATSADLSVSQIDMPDPVSAGNQVSYAITIANDGPDDATDVVLTDTLPSGTSLVSVEGTTCSAQGQVLTCALGPLAAESSIEISIVVSTAAVSSPTTVVNAASVAATEDDPFMGNNQASEATLIEPPPTDPDTASGWITAAGGTVATNASKPPTKKDPMTTSVTVPPGFPGVVTIAEGPIVACPVGFDCFGNGLRSPPRRRPPRTRSCSSSRTTRAPCRPEPSWTS